MAKLSICAWNVIKKYLQSSVADNDAVPGASIAVQTYGDFLNFNPHLHAIVSDGCFSQDGDFQMAPGFMLEDLEEIFQYEVLKMLKKEGKITDAKVVYTSKDRKSRKTFKFLTFRLCYGLAGQAGDTYSRSVRTDGEVLRLVFEQISGDEKKGRSG